MSTSLFVLVFMGFMTLLFIFYWRTIALHKRCPICKNTHVDRIKRPRWLKRNLGFVPLQAFHCDDCHHSFYHLAPKPMH